MPIVNVAFQVLLKTKEDSTCHIVDKAIEVVQKSRVKYAVGAMKTVMEGELDELINIVKKHNKLVLKLGLQNS